MQDLSDFSRCFNRLEALLLNQQFERHQHQPPFVPVSVSVSRPAVAPCSDRPFFPPASVTSASAVPALVSVLPPATVSIPPTPASAAVSAPTESCQAVSTIQDMAQAPPVVPPASDPSGDDLDCVEVPPEVDEGEISETDPDWSVDHMSEDQTYRETVRSIRSYMGWDEVPTFEAPATQADNPFAGLKPPAPSKLSTKLPPDEWLCRKIDNLNITMKEGYPTRTTDAAGLAKDQFIKVPPTQRWYSMHHPKTDFVKSKSSFWHNEPARLNNTFNRIAKQAIATRIPASRPISQDTLRRWEKSARDASIICNQAAGFNRCLTRVQDALATQVASLQQDKRKASDQDPWGEVNFLVDFNASISRALARSMQDLSEFVFVSWTNFTLLRRDSYLDFVRSGIKPDTFMALRNGPLHQASLFPEEMLTRVEAELGSFDNRQASNFPLKQRFNRPAPYPAQNRPAQDRFRGATHATHANSAPVWKQVAQKGGPRRHKARASQFVQKPAKGQQSYK